MLPHVNTPCCQKWPFSLPTSSLPPPPWARFPATHNINIQKLQPPYTNTIKLLSNAYLEKSPSVTTIRINLFTF